MSKKSKNIFLTVFVSLLSSAAAYAIFRAGKAMSKVSPERSIREQVSKTEYAQLIEYIIAQSKVESKNYTSELYSKQNNLFGMKNATNRPQLGTSVPGSEYRYYKSPEQSILDYINLLRSNNFPTQVSSAQKFAEYLKDDGYYQAPVDQYTKALISWL